jgi:hypothetical protein
MSSSKNIFLQRAGAYLSEAQSPIYSPPFTLHVYRFILIHIGGGGGVS